MRFLADMGVARSTVRALRDQGHDVDHLLDTGPHDLTDAAILERARADRRVTDQSPSSATPKILAAVERFGVELEAGALLVVEAARCRLRRLPLG